MEIEKRNIKEVHDMKMVRQIFSLLSKKYKLYFVPISLLLLVSAVLTQVMPLTVGYLTDSLLRSGIFETRLIVTLLLLILVINIVNETVKVIRRLMVESVATSTEKTARIKATDSLLRAPLAYFRQHLTGNIHGRLNRSIEGTVKVIKLLFMDFVPSVCNGILAIGVMFYKLPFVIAAAGILVVPIGTAIVLRQIKTQKGIRIELMESKAEMDGTVVELLGGIETIRSLDSAQMESRRIGGKSDFLRDKEMRHHRAMASYDFLKFVNEAVFHVLLLGLSVYYASIGCITVGTVLTAYLCFTQLTSPLRELHRILDELSEGLVLAQDYFRIITIREDFSYRIDQKASRDEIRTYDIKMEHVSIAYEEKPDHIVVSDMNLDIADGEFLGIAGLSGCGKSSLIKAIDRLENAEGLIRIGGVDVARISREILGEIVCLVPQTPFLISDTVYNNICYGIKREVSLEEVREAAKKANIDETIEQFQDGYDHMISEGGKNFSGGQRQRIALARIILRKPKIMILDEATSALDNNTEKDVMEEIMKLQKETHSTVIAIAHRLSSLHWCDRIIVMDKGRIIEEGSFEALKNAAGPFQKMLNQK